MLRHLLFMRGAPPSLPRQAPRLRPPGLRQALRNLRQARLRPPPKISHPSTPASANSRRRLPCSRAGLHRRPIRLLFFPLPWPLQLPLPPFLPLRLPPPSPSPAISSPAPSALRTKEKTSNNSKSTSTPTDSFLSLMVPAPRATKRNATAPQLTTPSPDSRRRMPMRFFCLSSWTTAPAISDPSQEVK